jgi:hypothetical protein
MEPASPAHPPVRRADTSADRSRESEARILPSAGTSWMLIVLLLSVLASGTLLGLATVEPKYAGTRFRLVRILDDHREQVAFTGAACLVAAGVLFLLTRLPT